MSIVKNEKCILVYGLTQEEREKIEATGNKVLMITNDMMNTKVKDIISEEKANIISEKTFNEKVVLFNNLSDEELNMLIKISREVINKPILAVVTPNTREWEFIRLIEHLMEEREWHRNRQKGRA